MLVARVKRRKQWFWLVLLLAIFLFLSILVIVFSLNDTKNKPELDQTVAIQPYPEKITSKLLFLGNTFWGRYIHDWSMASPLGYAYPFSRLNELNREDYNAWISGIECPITEGVNPSSAEQEAQLQFNCRPEYLSEATKWFNIFTLANNHTDNQNGIEGFRETQRHLESAGIQYFGHYDPRVTEDICEVVAMPVTVLNNDESSFNGKLPVAMCGHHGVFMIPDQASRQVMEKYKPYMPIIAMPHMGAEYKPVPDEIKTNFYRSLIDYGADMVIGDHPHWVQSSESYNGRLIVYSLGNFMFDQQGTSELTRSAGIVVSLSIKGVQKSQLQQWLQVGEDCVTYKDDCLEQIIKKELKKLPIEYQFSVIGTDNDNKIVKPATTEQLSSILQRLNWQNTINNLEHPYSGI